jgi:hypothetical protein
MTRMELPTATRARHLCAVSWRTRSATERQARRHPPTIPAPHANTIRGSMAERIKMDARGLYRPVTIRVASALPEAAGPFRRLS